MPDLPTNFNRGELVRAEWFAEIKRRLERLENLTFNGGDFSTKDFGTGRSVSLVPGRRIRDAAVTATRFGHIFHATSTPMLLVQFLKHEITTVDNRPQGEWVTDGNPRAAWLFPNAQGSDVVTLATPDFASTTPVVRLDRINDVWYVTWVPRWTIRDLPSTASRVRCN